jgi:cystathionine beta-lyase
LPELDIPKSFLAQGVAVSPGEQFGSKHFFRLNFGTSRPILEQALEKMSKAIKAYQ